MSKKRTEDVLRLIRSRIGSCFGFGWGGSGRHIAPYRTLDLQKRGSIRLPAGIIVGVAIALWLGVFTAHNANDWLTSSYEKRGYKLTGGIEADSAKEALCTYREPKRHRVMLKNASSGRLGEIPTVTRSKIVA